jgi:hypothetical protein
MQVDTAIIDQDGVSNTLSIIGDSYMLLIRYHSTKVNMEFEIGRYHLNDEVLIQIITLLESLPFHSKLIHEQNTLKTDLSSWTYDLSIYDGINGHARSEISSHSFKELFQNIELFRLCL